jgi:SHS2 domain-containing protein
MERGRYEYLPEIATADVAFRARGRTLEQMLLAATDATLEVMLPEPRSLEGRVRKEIRLSAENEEMLLHDLLEELIFLKDAKRLLLRVESVKISRPAGGHALDLVANCAGDEINPEKYSLGVDVKAVTMHLFQVKETHDGWDAQVILDI